MVAKTMHESSSACFTRSPSNCSLRIPLLIRSDRASWVREVCLTSERRVSMHGCQRGRSRTEEQIAGDQRQTKPHKAGDQQTVIALVKSRTLDFVHEQADELVPLCLDALSEIPLLCRASCISQQHAPGSARSVVFTNLSASTKASVLVHKDFHSL